MSSSTTKFCFSCKIEKPHLEFNKNILKKDGLEYQCKLCRSKAFKLSYPKIKEIRMEKYRIYRANNRDIIKEKRAKYYNNNRDSFLKKGKEYISNPKNFSKKRLTEKNWRQKNKPHLAAKTANRRALVLKRTSPWAIEMMNDYMKLMQKFSSSLSKRTGVKHAVDHIIPVQGKLGSGLNLPWNLAIIPHADNCSKSNKFEPQTINYKNGIPVIEGV